MEKHPPIFNNFLSDRASIFLFWFWNWEICHLIFTPTTGLFILSSCIKTQNKINREKISAHTLNNSEEKKLHNHVAVMKICFCQFLVNYYKCLKALQRKLIFFLECIKQCLKIGFNNTQFPFPTKKCVSSMTLLF